MQVDILTLIGNYAFPIVMSLALLWKMDRDNKTNMEAQEKRDALHREEVASLRESLDNNTAALVQLQLSIKTREA